MNKPSIADCIDAIYDNGGKSCDRYTVFVGEDVYGMSDNACAPNGFNQYIGSAMEKWHFDKLGKKLDRSEYPAVVIKALHRRYDYPQSLNDPE